MFIIFTVCHHTVKNQLEAKDVLPNINRTQSAKSTEKFLFCIWLPWPLIFDLQTRASEDKTRLLCEFGANPFSGSRDISYTIKKPQTDGAKNRTFRSSLRG